MPVLGLWAPRRKTKAQNRRTSLFVNQRFQHKHTNVSPFVSLTVVRFGSLFRTTGATSPEPLIRKKGKKRWGGGVDFIYVVVSFFFFFFTFIKCPVKYLTQVCSFQMKSWLILEVKPFRLKKIVFDSHCVSKISFHSSGTNDISPDFQLALLIFFSFNIIKHNFFLVSFFFPASASGFLQNSFLGLLDSNISVLEAEGVWRAN